MGSLIRHDLDVIPCSMVLQFHCSANRMVCVLQREVFGDTFDLETAGAAGLPPDALIPGEILTFLSGQSIARVEAVTSTTQAVYLPGSCESFKVTAAPGGICCCMDTPHSATSSQHLS